MMLMAAATGRREAEMRARAPQRATRQRACVIKINGCLGGARGAAAADLQIVIIGSTSIFDRMVTLRLSLEREYSSSRYSYSRDLVRPARRLYILLLRSQ